MGKRWSKDEEDANRIELKILYAKENKTIGEISKILKISDKTVFQRIKRLGIKSTPHLKKNYIRKPRKVYIPKYSQDLAEFFGIMLGDGHLTHFQVQVNLGNKEYEYAKYVCNLISEVFKIEAKISVRKSGYYDVYFGSTIVTSWLQKQGLVFNKVKQQVRVPKWIYGNKQYMKRFLRGFFDTDGSIYKIKFGVQISLTNYSVPILLSLHEMLIRLGYSPSEISSNKIYLTRVPDIRNFFAEIRPKNPKHIRRFESLI